jgi:23S rRNA pseudouridine1911/1915/1917 synthase
MTGAYTVPPGARPDRADKILAAAFPAHSRTAWQRAFDAGLVAMDGEPIARKQTVGPGDEIEYAFPEVKVAPLRPVALPLDVLFEDEHCIALNKAAGMVVHPGAGTGEDTLVHALLAHCAGSLSGVGGVERPGIVHRLDRETSGVIIVAKHDAAHRALAGQFAERTLEKTYLAAVDGVPRLLSGSLRAPIGRNPQHRHKMAVVEGPTGREAHTDWEVKERFGTRAALVACHIHTGRTHQIRVHLKHLGHVLLGDVVYGWKARPDLVVPRVMLHAARLALSHPHTGEPLVLEAPPPADFQAVMAALRSPA